MANNEHKLIGKYSGMCNRISDIVYGTMGCILELDPNTHTRTHSTRKLPTWYPQTMFARLQWPGERWWKITHIYGNTEQRPSVLQTIGVVASILRQQRYRSHQHRTLRRFQREIWNIHMDTHTHTHTHKFRHTHTHTHNHTCTHTHTHTHTHTDIDTDTDTQIHTYVWTGGLHDNQDGTVKNTTDL